MAQDSNIFQQYKDRLDADKTFDSESGRIALAILLLAEQVEVLKWNLAKPQTGR